MKIYNQAVIGDKKINIDGKGYEYTLGKHCIWIPAIETKLVLSFHGGIDPNGFHKDEKRIKVDPNFNREKRGWDISALYSVCNEVTILNKLSKIKMSPIVKDLVFVKNVISKLFTTAVHCDSQGWSGYEIQDASKLPPGDYSFEKFKVNFLDTGEITASEGAIGDLAKKEGNLVNGYLVDVRRSLFDMMQVKNLEAFDTTASVNREDLQKRIRKYGQFPFMERSQNYQAYYLDGWWYSGTRDPLHRFEVMGIKSLDNKTLLDLGCQMGSMAFEAYRRGATKVTGIEFQPEFIDCARDLARVNGEYVNFQIMDLKKTSEVSEYINRYYPEGVDVVFALSLYKHIKASLFELLKTINFRVLYLESHNTGTEGINCGHVQEMIQYMKRFGWKYEVIGTTRDRSPRIVWRVTK